MSTCNHASQVYPALIVQLKINYSDQLINKIVGYELE